MPSSKLGDICRNEFKRIENHLKLISHPGGIQTHSILTETRLKVWALTPLHSGRYLLVGRVGFEPTFSTTTTVLVFIRHRWYLPIILVGEVRLELTYWKVHYDNLLTQITFTEWCRYSPIVGGVRFELTNPKERFYRPRALAACIPTN